MALRFRNINAHQLETLHLFKHAKTIVVFDTETTGLEADAKIIQFSAILYQIREDGSILDEIDTFDTYINPNEPISDEIIQLTGITNEILKTGISETEAANKICEFMNKGDIWAAYNSPFDIEKLNTLYQRTHHIFAVKPTVDILLLARNCIPASEMKNFKLGTITKYLRPELFVGANSIQFHNAIEDVRATGFCIEKLITRYKDLKNPQMGNLKISVNYCNYWQNPKQGNMRRIYVNMLNGQKAPVFWDCRMHAWGCNANKKAEKEFLEVDLAYLERQILEKYSYNSIDDWAYGFAHAARERQKNITKQYQSFNQIIAQDAKESSEIELL